jgi:hypothetical protein
MERVAGPYCMWQDAWVVLRLLNPPAAVSGGSYCFAILHFLSECRIEGKEKKEAGKET